MARGNKCALIIQFYFPQNKRTNYLGSCHLRPFKCSTSSMCLSGCKNECLSRQEKHHTIDIFLNSISRSVGCCIFPRFWSIHIWITFSSEDGLTKTLLSIFPHGLYSHIYALCGFTERAQLFPCASVQTTSQCHVQPRQSSSSNPIPIPLTLLFSNT